MSKQTALIKAVLSVLGYEMEVVLLWSGFLLLFYQKTIFSQEMLLFMSYGSTYIKLVIFQSYI